MEYYGRRIVAEIRPFRGTFYNPNTIEDLSQVLAPPYDVIGDEMKESLLGRSPHNIVRLILPQSHEDQQFWNTSAELFEEWKDRKVFTGDEQACIYAYRQKFELPDSHRCSRLGILAILKCRDLSAGVVLPHEKTFPRTLEERLNLLRACRANFSQVFMSFRDPDEEVGKLLEWVAAGPVFLQFEDDEGTHHELWRIRERDDINGLVSMLADKKLIIADGHHRYETALAYSGEKQATGDESCPRDYVCTTLFRSEDTGMVILPVHRLLKHLPMPVEEASSRLERFFDLEEIQGNALSRRGIAKELERIDETSFVMITSNSAVQLFLKRGLDLKDILKGPESDKWKCLSISVLHSLLLGECLGLDADHLAERGELYFTPWEGVALSAVTDGRADAAFLVRATRMQEIWEIAEGGERMPHKSSYFYPKLPSGMVIYDHRIGLQE